MKTLSKYFLKKFIVYFFASFITVSFFTFIINFFENMNNASKKGLDIFFVLKNTFYETPYFIFLLIPLVVFFAAILSFNYFYVTNEYKAVYSGGYSSFVFIAPLVLTSITIFIFSIAFFDIFAVKMYRKNIEIKKKDVSMMENYYINLDDIYLGAKKIKGKMLFDVYLENKDNIIIVKKIFYKEGVWLGENVKIVDKNKFNVSFYNKYEFKFLPAFENIIVERFISDAYYDLFSLFKRIKKLSKLSMDRITELSVFYFKISLMFLSIISVFVSYLISQTQLIKHKAFAISFAMVISFIMWFVIITIKRISDIGLISPAMIFFIPHILFIGVIILIFKRMEIKYG